jgi:hypothetical protein
MKVMAHSPAAGMGIGGGGRRGNSGGPPSAAGMSARSQRQSQLGTPPWSMIEPRRLCSSSSSRTRARKSAVTAAERLGGGRCGTPPLLPVAAIDATAGGVCGPTTNYFWGRSTPKIAIFANVRKKAQTTRNVNSDGKQGLMAWSRDPIGAGPVPAKWRHFPLHQRCEVVR